MFDVLSWLVWMFPLISSLFVPLVARFSGKARDYLVVIVSLITAAFAFLLIPDVYSGFAGFFDLSASWIPSSGINAGVFIDPLSVLFTVLVAFFGLIIAIYSLGYMKGEDGLTRYYFFLLLFIGSMIGLVISDNFFQMFIFWEMVGLCSYALISFWYRRPESVRAAVKAFLMTRIGDISLLGAIGLLYASLSSFSFRYTIANIGTIPIPTLTAVAFLALGAAVVKSAQLPLHTWLYSAMEAPTSISAILHAATMVKAGVYLIARLILILGSLAFSLHLWLPSVASVGVLTAFIGATLALYTPDIKGVLAYSTVSQVGLMFAALGTVSLSSSLGWFASLFHAISHAFFEGLGFLLAGGIIHAIGTRDMRLMGGLRKAMPVTFGLAVIMMLTTSGLPPFAAFFSKGLIISSITEAGNLWQVILTYATTALTFAYSLRFVTLVFLGKESEHLEKLHVHEAPKIMLYPAVILAALCVVWGFVEPWLGSFMRAGSEMSLLAVLFNAETPIFFAIVVPTGLIMYLIHYRKTEVMTKIQSGLNPLATILKHGYFFDDLYERIIASRTVRLSKGIRTVEVVLFSRIPAIVATSVISLANAVHKYLDVSANELLNIITHRTLRSASKMKNTQTSLQLYIAAALLGFILVLILLILTIGV